MAFVGDDEDSPGRGFVPSLYWPLEVPGRLQLLKALRFGALGRVLGALGPTRRGSQEPS